MTRISTFCAVSSALAVLALSANGASAVDAASPKFAVPTPKVTVNPVQPKNAVGIGGTGGHSLGSANPAGSKHFEIKDFSFGVENPTTVGSSTKGAGAGKVKFNEFSIGKTTDTASPILFKQSLRGSATTTTPSKSSRLRSSTSALHP